VFWCFFYYNLFIFYLRIFLNHFNWDGKIIL
jgi:hypothetical protein